jgi:hypothetical protein
MAKKISPSGFFRCREWNWPLSFSCGGHYFVSASAGVKCTPASFVSILHDPFFSAFFQSINGSWIEYL